MGGEVALSVTHIVLANGAARLTVEPDPWNSDNRAVPQIPLTAAIASERLFDPHRRKARIGHKQFLTDADLERSPLVTFPERSFRVQLDQSVQRIIISHTPLAIALVRGFTAPVREGTVLTTPSQLLACAI
jgi:hypothetical protein